MFLAGSLFLQRKWFPCDLELVPRTTLLLVCSSHSVKERKRSPKPISLLKVRKPAAGVSVFPTRDIQTYIDQECAHF